MKKQKTHINLALFIFVVIQLIARIEAQCPPADDPTKTKYSRSNNLFGGICIQTFIPCDTGYKGSTTANTDCNNCGDTHRFDRPTSDNARTCILKSANTCAPDFKLNKVSTDSSAVCIANTGTCSTGYTN